MKKIFAALLALMMILCACGTAGAKQEAKKMEIAADADAFIAAFLGEHPEELDGRWALSEQMEAAITQLGGFCGLAKQLAVLGGGRILRQGETREVLAHSDELEAAGVNCPRVTTLSRLLEQPVCVNLDEAEEMVRRLIP